ncbi:unnamed protein product, partial [Mesorhabditis spiculigera]
MKFVLLSALVAAAVATDGWDGIQAVSADGFKCLANNGYSFFIARVWESVGNFDTTGIQNIKNARAAGWNDVDGYIFPCLRSGCAPPANQIEATVNKLNAEGAQFGMLWLDLERFEWPADRNANRNYISALGNQLDAMHINWGIYTNYNNWEAIVGADWAQWSSKPLWWATYDGRKDMADFKPFGGWTKAVNVDGFKCLAAHNYSFFVARVWHSYGDYDETGIQNIKNARAAGWKDVDGYIFPYTKCCQKLNAENANFGMLWLDIEIFEWPDNKTANQDFISELCKELDAQKVQWGIYSSAHNWLNIVGLDWAVWKDKPLWWATYDGKKDYADFKSFGGWTKPAIHQWAGSVSGPCGVNMDLNYYP